MQDSLKVILTGLLSVCSYMALTASQAAAAPAKAKAEAKELVVTQLDNTIYLTDEAVKIKNNTGNFILVAKAPDWKVTCFRTDRKVYWQSDLNRFSGVMLLHPCVSAKDPIQAKLLGEKKYKGYDCVYYQSKKGMLVYGAKNIRIPSKVAELLCRYFFLPSIKEIPLFESTASEEKYQQKEWFDAHRYKDFLQRTPVATKSITTKAYDPKDFAIPPGLKKMKLPTEVSFSDANRNDLEGMIEGVGFMGKDK